MSDDCGQDDVCAEAPGCSRHWAERVREVMAERDAALAATVNAALIHADLVRERDEARAKLDAELPAMWREDIASLNECLERVGRERDALREEVGRLQRLLDHATQANPGTSTLVMLMNEASAVRAERDLLKNHYLPEAAAKLRAELASARAEIEMLRGVGCREAKEGEPESGPCGVCLRCAEERGAKWALAQAHREVCFAVDQERAGINVRRLTGWEICRDARRER